MLADVWRGGPAMERPVVALAVSLESANRRTPAADGRWSSGRICPEAVVYDGGKADRMGLDSVVHYGVTIETTVVKCAGYRSPVLP
jgi:hypothetical protein